MIALPGIDTSGVDVKENACDNDRSNQRAKRHDNSLQGGRSELTGAGSYPGPARNGNGIYGTARRDGTITNSVARAVFVRSYARPDSEKLKYLIRIR
jgi:hypothetical protein